MIIKKAKDCPLKDADFVDGSLIENISYRKMAAGEKMLSTVTYYKKGAVLSMHKHRREEIGYIASGKIKLTSNNEEEVLEKGDTYAIIEKVEHEIEALEDSEIVTFFAPVE
ncbi:cupin domain-containing protein [Candidatus Peregrinibacteria bacterium]|jgi:quercetin dioxygenase-like cupin family protein|nr:cupin domain-containing protein [Candidatus Peregrinibacteria bacterium]